MFRSFDDRVLGGVIGGLAARLPISSMLLRLIWIVLSLLSSGIFAALYLVLWWVTPQESNFRKRREALPLLGFLLLAALAVALWIARDTGALQLADGVSLYGPILALAVTLVFFLRQVRA